MILFIKLCSLVWISSFKNYLKSCQSRVLLVGLIVTFIIPMEEYLISEISNLCSYDKIILYLFFVFHLFSRLSLFGCIHNNMCIRAKQYLFDQLILHIDRELIDFFSLKKFLKSAVFSISHIHRLRVFKKLFITWQKKSQFGISGGEINPVKSVQCEGKLVKK